MKLYYRAVTQDGKTIRGLIDAKDEHEAAKYLRKHQFLPVKIVPDNKSGISQWFLFYKRPSQNDLIFFTRQLSSMLSSGLTLMQGLSLLKDQLRTPAMVAMVQTVIADVEDGKKLSAAIEKYPAIFSPIYIALIRTAETSGLMDKVLLRLADNLEKRQMLQRMIKGALLYPVVIIVMMILVIAVMMIFVIPQLSQLYGDMKMTLPLSTTIVIESSKFFVVAWPFMLGMMVIGSVGIQRWYRTEAGRKFVDRFVLKIPIIGVLLVQSMMAEFTRTLGLLINAGSLVVDSLVKSSDVVDNLLYKDAIVFVAKRVEKGISVGDAMEASPLFPAMAVEMVKIGEQTGKLDESLIKASEYFEREVEQQVKVLTTLMEPIIMIVLALGVGFLVFAIITPIYNLISSIQ